VKRKRTVLFLYTRLPEYFYRCVEYFTETYDCRVVVIRYRDDPDTRYSFSPSDKIELHYKEEVNIKKLVSGSNPDVLVISSWTDKQYTSIGAKYVRRIPVVIALDNPYSGSLKQRILCMLSSFTLKRFCNKVWIAGPGQYEYAARLGFAKVDIVHNMYAADSEIFYNLGKMTLESKKIEYPRTIVFVGRVVEYKQPDILAELFTELVKEHALKWKLVIAGEGPMKEYIRSRNYPNVELIDFLPPSELPSFYQNAGIFCLPSKGEHWGVAVHEAASAGLALLLSDSVESANTFLIHGYNGYLFKSGDKGSLKNSLLKLMNEKEETLIKMGENSVELSRRNSHATWAASLYSLILNGE
jgi:glycosyltransferase involved in cell wall biosynthesis